MDRLYRGLSDFEIQQEKEFHKAVDEIGYYSGTEERRTLDGEWAEDELKADVWDEMNKLLNGDKHTNSKGWLDKNKERALKDYDLVKVDYLTEYIINNNDLVENYNRLYDKHRNDDNKKFGIVYFDEWLVEIGTRTLNQNKLIQD